MAVIIAAQATAETVEEAAAAATATSTTAAADVIEKDTLPEAAEAGADISVTGPVMDPAMAADTKVAAGAEVAGEGGAGEVTVTPPHARHQTNLTEC